MPTMQQLCDRGRIPLNDADKDRFSDERLLEWGVSGILEAYRIRPDLRFGSYGAKSRAMSLALTSTFPLPDSAFQAVADYIVFRAETPSDESVDTSRAQAFLVIFEKSLLS